MATVNDIYQITFVCVRGNQVGLNVRHYLVTAVGGAGVTDAQIGAHFNTTFGPLYQELLSSTATFNGVMVQKIRPLPVLAVVPVAAGTLAGLRTGDPLPMQVSGIITLRTEFAGRGNRGRAYIPFPAETSNDGTQIPTGQYVEDLDALGLEFTTTQIPAVGVTSVTMAPIVFRRGPGTGTQITGRRANQRWATQRRRGLYGASNIPGVE